jgi:hypothetical protein
VGGFIVVALNPDGLNLGLGDQQHLRKAVGISLLGFDMATESGMGSRDPNLNVAGYRIPGLGLGKNAGSSPPTVSPLG